MYVAAAAAVVGAVGSLMKSQGEADALDSQAKLQRQNATIAMGAARQNAERQQILAGEKLGSISADYAASGVDIHSSGSVLAVLGASAANSELDRQNILHGGELRAINYGNQASLDEKAAGNALKSGYFGAGASLVGGATKLYSYKHGGGIDNLSQDRQWFGDGSDDDSMVLKAKSASELFGVDN